MDQVIFLMVKKGIVSYLVILDNIIYCIYYCRLIVMGYSCVNQCYFFYICGICKID